MKSDLTFTDQFCGCGGSSQGIKAAANKFKGLKIKLALNHWQLAIATHQSNFKDTEHHCTDIQAADPRYFPTTDILVTSPECTNHSLAKGKKQVKQNLDLFTKGILDPAAERSRATMWDVPRFAEVHQYKAIIVENVVDARTWIMWDAWLLAMHSLGYMHKCVYINSQHCHPTPQSRDRMYVVFWKKGQRAPKLDFTPLAFCYKCNEDVEARQTWKNKLKPYGKYKQQYYYTCPSHGIEVEPYYFAAFNAIDWTNPGKKIGDRKKPLSPNTMLRIQYGLDHYSDPCIVTARYTTGIDFRVKPVSNPIPTQPGDASHAIMTPFIIKGEHTLCKPTSYVGSASKPFGTQTGRQSMAILMPKIVELNSSGKARSTIDPLATILANGNHHWLLTPTIANNKGQSTSKQIVDPTATQTTKPSMGIVTSEAWASFIHYNRDQLVSHISKPINTIATMQQTSVVSFNKPKIEDCYYRMLLDTEIQSAMAFEDNYIILGNSKNKVKQLGNAVTPPVMEWLVDKVVESLN